MTAPSGRQTAVLQSDKGRVIVIDSISYLEQANQGDVIICGSHGGIPAASYALSYNPRCIFFNDAGKGKDNAGIQGLRLLDETGVPAAAVDTMTARIGEGMDTYENGLLSAVNSAAHKAGMREGMPVREAAPLILKSFPERC